MENNPLVSIIIPIYKVEQYLEQCLDSCLAQTYKNIEIIAVNDGSPDTCGDIINQYAAKDSRVKHLQQENQGAPMARWNGMQMSKGEYIMQVDGDDFIPENAVLCLIEEAIKYDCDMVFSDLYFVTGSELRISTLPVMNGLMMSGHDFFEEPIRLEIVGRVIKRELFLHYELPKEHMGEDVFTMTQIMNNCKKVRYMKCPLYYYRTTDGSAMHTPSTVKNEIEFWVVMLDFINTNNYSKIVKRYSALHSLTIISKYINDYNNTITKSADKEIDKLIRLAIKSYPRMVRDIIMNIDHYKAIIIAYILRYFPKMVSVLHKYNKLRGKSNV